MPVEQRETTIAGDSGRPLRVALTLPDETARPSPAVVIVYEVFGLAPDMLAVARRFAENGYASSAEARRASWYAGGRRPGGSMKARDLKDRAVVSMADGVQIGRVEDVLFDTTALRVAALALTTTGGHSILPFAAVRSLGADAVTVENATAAQPASTQSPAGTVLRSMANLAGLKVVNGEGAYLGDVRDVEVDQSGAVTGIEAHRGGMLGLGGTSVAIPASAIRGIGPELVTADLPAPASGDAKA